MTINEEDIKKEGQTEKDPDAEKPEKGEEAEETGKAGNEASEEKSEEAEDEKTKAEDPDAEDEALQTKYMRLMADFQNYKRRAEKEKLDNAAYANEKIVVQLLEVMDNFERALAHDADDEFKKGMVMIFDQLQGVLEKAGVEEIDTEDADFDPNFHNAVMMEDTDDVESGKVSAVLQKGYKLNGKVIRPSMVKVAN